MLEIKRDEGREPGAMTLQLLCHPPDRALFLRFLLLIRIVNCIGFRYDLRATAAARFLFSEDLFPEDLSVQSQVPVSTNHSI